MLSWICGEAIRPENWILEAVMNRVRSSADGKGAMHLHCHDRFTGQTARMRPGLPPLWC